MERTERVILTNMCMIQNGSKVLVEEKVGQGAGGIIFPGGHVEEHEPIVDSVIRDFFRGGPGFLAGEGGSTENELDLAYGRPDADHGGR